MIDVSVIVPAYNSEETAALPQLAIPDWKRRADASLPLATTTMSGTPEN